MSSVLRRASQKFLSKFNRTVLPKATIPMNARNMQHFCLLIDLYTKISGLTGAVVECGVGKGRSFLQFSYLAQKENKGRNIWGFDSFEGFPMPTTEDISMRNPKKGDWSGTSSRDIVAVLRTAGLESEFIKAQTHLIPGFFDQTLKSYSGGPIAFLHVDADLYSSYKEALEMLVPQVVEGGVVLFDEYGHEKWPGATVAVDEFLAGTPWKLEYHTLGDRWFFIKTS